VAVARALAINPGILLLDEPFAALDRKLREEMQVEIMRLHERLQVTTVFVTHDQREAFTLSDRIAVMNEGRIEQLDTPQAVYYRPESQFVADFVGLSNLFKVQIITHNGDTSIVELPEEGVQLEVPIDRGTTLNDSHFLFIRPEFIKLESEDRVDASCLTATVDLIRFVGELIETRLTTQGGAQVVATYQGREMPQLAAGQKVSIRLYTQNARLLQ
jgi:putative spermidine/putrescine transport system ATP-binding protein